MGLILERVWHEMRNKVGGKSRETGR